MGHPPLGEVCQELGLMDATRVALVSARMAEGNGMPFADAALALGFLDDDGVARALAHQFRLNLVPADRLGALRVSPKVLPLLPPDLVRARRLVPTFLDAERGVLTLLCADPTDVAGLRAAQTAAGAMRLRLFVAPKNAIERLIERLLTNPTGAEDSPSSGRTILYEPDVQRATILRQLEVVEGSEAIVLESVEAVSAAVEEGRVERIFFRRGLEGVVTALIADWRRIQPSLQLCPLDGFGVGTRPAVRYEAARDFLVGVIQRLVVSRPGHASAARRHVLIERLARLLDLEPEVTDAAIALGLLHDIDPEPPNPDDDFSVSRAARVARWFERQDPPWDLPAACAVLERRMAGQEGPSDDIVVEVVFTAAAVASAGVADGMDPLVALGTDAARHDAEVLGALHQALVPEPRLRVVEPPGSTSGRLEDIALAELLQLLTLGGKTALVRVQSDADAGVIQVRGGRLRGARSRHTEGTEALFALVGVERGTFDVWFLDTGPTNIDTDSEFLILEALRRRDERREHG